MEQPVKYDHVEIIDDIQLLMMTYGMAILFDINRLQSLLFLEFKYKAPLCLLEKLIG